jgi:hypothetical protein
MAAGTSTVSFKFTPNNPHGTLTKGSLNVHTHTNYTGATQTDKATLHFDDNFHVNTGAKPKCDKSKLGGNKTLAQAQAACGNALIGKGTAKAKAGVNTVNACVRAYNGSGTGGHVLLFTRAQASPPFTINCSTNGSQGNTTVLLDGKYSANPSSLGGDFSGGKTLTFANITGASPLPLIDFNVTVGKPIAPAYVKGNCTDSNHKWNMNTKFNYVNPSSSQTITSSQACS